MVALVTGGDRASLDRGHVELHHQGADGHAVPSQRLDDQDAGAGALFLVDESDAGGKGLQVPVSWIGALVLLTGEACAGHDLCGGFRADSSGELRWLSCFGYCCWSQFPPAHTR